VGRTVARHMIKDIQLYPEMANPQLRPRYSGLDLVGCDVVALAFKQRQGAL